MDHERWRCAEVFCAKTTFAEATLEAPPRARGTTRLKTAISRAVAGEVRSVDRVATQFGVSWATVATPDQHSSRRRCPHKAEPSTAGHRAGDR